MGFGFPKLAPACFDSVSIFLWDTGPSFYLLYVSYLCLSLVKSSLYIHSGLLPPLLDFSLGWIFFLSLEEAILENKPSLLDPSSLQNSISWDSSKQILDRLESALPKSMVVTLLLPGSHFSKSGILPSHGHCITRLPPIFKSPTGDPRGLQVHCML